MAVTARFSRARTGEQRLTLDVSTPDLEALSLAWVISSRRILPGGFSTRITVAGDRIDQLLEVLDTIPGPLADTAATVRTRRRALENRAPRPAPEGPGDPELRDLTHSLNPHPCTCGNVLFVAELGLNYGQRRTDMAWLCPHHWTGVEIKGAADTLTRLDGQIPAYDAIFDTSHIVTAATHADHLTTVPDTWGLHVHNPDTGQLVTRRTPLATPGDPHARARLLWRDELEAILRTHKIPRLSRTVREDQARILADLHSPDSLRQTVYHRLRTRQGWLGLDGRPRSTL